MRSTFQNGSGVHYSVVLLDSPGAVLCTILTASPTGAQSSTLDELLCSTG